MIHVSIYIPRTAPDGTLISAHYERVIEAHLADLFGGFVRENQSPLDRADPTLVARYDVLLRSLSEGSKFALVAQVAHVLAGVTGIVVETGTHREDVHSPDAGDPFEESGPPTLVDPVEIDLPIRAA